MSGAVCSACTKPPSSISASISPSGTRWTRDVLARLGRGGASPGHPLGEEGVGEVVLQRRVRRQASSAATSGRRRSRSPRAARGAPPPRATCPRDRSCRRGSRSGPAPMPWRYWRMRTTSSSSVSATTFTQGGYSLTQYSGMIVPFGSSTRSTRTVYQSFFARYSRDEHLPGAGDRRRKSSRHRALPAMTAARAREHRAHHGRRQLAGVGVLAARVVAAEQQRQPGAEGGLAAVAERAGAGAGGRRGSRRR